jgi:glycosyltransferase involved in cell wall biosynthesis
MHIAVDGTALYGRYNGVEYALWNLLSAINVIDGVNLYTVYIPADGPPPERLAVFGPRWRWIRLPFTGGAKFRRIAWQQFELPRLLAREKFDLLHAPTYVSPLLSPVPVVLTVYDTIALTHPEFATTANRLHYSFILPPSVRRAHRVIVPGDEVRQDVVRLAPSAVGKTRIVELGVEPIFHITPDDTAVNEVRERYQLPERFVLFVGNWEPKKNMVRLLRAVTSLPDAPPVVLAGGGRAWSLLELEAIQQMGKSGGLRIHRTGYVWRRDLPALYHLCNVFAFPSLAEGFGLPVLEALACGAPVVTSDRVPIAGVSEAALVCDPTEEASIAAALARVLVDHDLRNSLGQRARAFARPFTTKRTAEETLSVYRDALS